jgi:hypothetical protein
VILLVIGLVDPNRGFLFSQAPIVMECTCDLCYYFGPHWLCTIKEGSHCSNYKGENSGSSYGDGFIYAWFDDIWSICDSSDCIKTCISLYSTQCMFKNSSLEIKGLLLIQTDGLIYNFLKCSVDFIRDEMVYLSPQLKTVFNF